MLSKISSQLTYSLVTHLHIHLWELRQAHESRHPLPLYLLPDPPSGIVCVCDKLEKPDSISCIVFTTQPWLRTIQNKVQLCDRVTHSSKTTC